MRCDGANAVRVLVLYGSLNPGIQRTCSWVERVAVEFGIVPLFAQGTDWAAVQELAAVAGYRILPLDDVAVGLAARLSPRMERPMLVGDPEPLQDKWGQRRALASHGLPSPPCDLVATEADVRECGRRWGYPLVLKPVCGTRSHGVRRVDGPAEIADALAAAQAAARATGLERVLAEGYLDGPDVAVESMVLGGVTCHVAFWQSGWSDNVWQAATPAGPALHPHLDAIGEAVEQANAALGLRWAATSNELRLTAAGPVIVEVNARLGGEPCEDAILLHNGVDRVRAMLTMLCGAAPELATRHCHPVVQTSIRATAPGLVRAVEVPADLGAAVRLELWVAPGTRIVDPSTSFLGWLLMQGQPGEHADHLLPRAAAYAQQIRLELS